MTVALDCRSFDQHAYAAHVLCERRELFSSIYGVAFVTHASAAADHETHIAAAYSSGLVRLFAIKDITSKWLGRQHKSGSSALTWQAHASAASGVKVIQAGGMTLLVTAGDDGALKLWDAEGLIAAAAAASNKADSWLPVDVKPHRVMQIPKVDGPYGVNSSAPGVVSMSVDESKRIIYVGASDGGVHAFDIHGRLATFVGHAASVLAIDFCSATSMLASGSEDGTVRLWSCGSLSARDGAGGMDVDLEGKPSESASCCSAIINPWDGVELPLKATPNELLQCFKSPHITALKFARDGGWLVVGTGNAALTLWSLTLGQCAQQLSTQSEPQAIHTLPGEILVACAESKLFTYGFTIDAPPKLTELCIRSCYALDVGRKSGMVAVAGSGGCLDLLSPYGARIGAVFPTSVDEQTQPPPP